MPSYESDRLLPVTPEEIEVLQFYRKQSKIGNAQLRAIRLKKWRERLDVTGVIANVAQIATGVVTFGILGSKAGSGTSYLTVPEIASEFGRSLSTSLRAVGQTFAFVGYVANGVRALWDLGVTGYRWAFQNEAAKIATLHPPEARVSLPTKKRLIGRTAANIIIATFNILAVITVIGLLASGIGLVAAAIASGIGWVKDSVIPWWNTRKELAEIKQEIKKIENTIRTEHLSATDDMTNSEREVKTKRRLELGAQLKSANQELNRLNEEYTTKRNSMILGAVSVVAFALFATGPFGLALLSTIGSVLLVTCTLIGVGRLIRGACKQSQAPESVSVAGVKKLTTESEVEFRQRRKLNHWMESSYKKLNAKMPFGVVEQSDSAPLIDEGNAMPDEKPASFVQASIEPQPVPQRRHSFSVR